MEEDDEHQFFFAFSEGIFSDPTGDGNIDNSADPVNYNDQDENGLPVGLSTGWTTQASTGSGTFQVILKHQPDIKGPNTGVGDGDTDFDLTWTVNTTTNVDELSATLNRQLVVAPNPAVDQLIWRIDGNFAGSPVEIRIISMMGQVMEVYNSPDPQINIGHLPTGSYIFQVQTGQARATKRFIKVN
jgi:hypothetical protein